jgi:hypothetical protein
MLSSSGHSSKRPRCDEDERRSNHGTSFHRKTAHPPHGTYSGSDLQEAKLAFASKCNEVNQLFSFFRVDFGCFFTLWFVIETRFCN